MFRQRKSLPKSSKVPQGNFLIKFLEEKSPAKICWGKSLSIIPFGKPGNNHRANLLHFGGKHRKDRVDEWVSFCQELDRLYQFTKYIFQRWTSVVGEIPHSIYAKIQESNKSEVMELCIKSSCIFKLKIFHPLWKDYLGKPLKVFNLLHLFSWSWDGSTCDPADCLLKQLTCLEMLGIMFEPKNLSIPIYILFILYICIHIFWILNVVQLVYNFIHFIGNLVQQKESRRSSVRSPSFSIHLLIRGQTPIMISSLNTRGADRKLEFIRFLTGVVFCFDGMSGGGGGFSHVYIYIIYTYVFLRCKWITMNSGNFRTSIKRVPKKYLLGSEFSEHLFFSKFSEPLSGVERQCSFRF